MRFKRTILAVSVLAAMGSVSGAEINLQETIKSQNGFDNLSSEFYALADSAVTVTVDDKSAVVLTSGGSFSLKGQGKVATFQFTGSHGDNGGTAMRFANGDQTATITFDEFKSLSFVGNEDKEKVSGWILGGETNFGSQTNRLDKLTFTNVSLASWSDYAKTVNVYANEFSIDQTISAPGTLVMNFYNSTTISSQTFAGGLSSVYRNSEGKDVQKHITINGGDVLIGSIGTSANAITAGIESAEVNLNVHSLKTGTDGSSDGGISTSGTINIITDANTSSAINGLIFVGETGKFNWAEGGNVTVNGNVRSEGSVSFGTKDGASLQSLTINGTNPNNNPTYPNGFLTAEAGTYIGAETFVLNGAFNVKGTTEVKSQNAQLAAYEGQEAVHLYENAALNFLDNGTEGQRLEIKSQSTMAVSINGGSMGVAAGSVEVTGGVGVNNSGKLILGTADESLTSIVIKNNNATKNTLSLGSGSTGSLYAAGDVSLQSSAQNGYSSVSLAGSGTKLDLQAGGTASFTGAVTMASSAQADISADSVTIDGYVRNANSDLNLKADNKITIITETDAGYSYSGVSSSGNTAVQAQTFEVYGSLTSAGTGSTFDVAAQNTVVDAGEGRAIAVSGGGKLAFKAVQGAQNQKLTLRSSSAGAALISGTQSELTVEAGAVEAYGTIQSNGAAIKLGAEDQKLSSVAVYGDGSARAILRSNGGDVSVWAGDVTIANEGQTAIDAFTLQRDGERETSSMRVHADNNLVVVGDIVSGKDGHSSQNILKDSLIDLSADGTTQIAGNIYTFNDDSYFKDGVETDGVTTNRVKVDISGGQSHLTGAIYDVGASAESGTGTTLALSDGAVWSVTDHSTLASLSADDAAIVTNGKDVTIDSLSNTGSGAQFETSSGRSQQITVSEYTGDFAVNITEEGMNEINPSDVAQSMASVVDAKAAAGTDGTILMHGAETALLGETTLAIDANGNISSYSEAPNTVSQGLQDIAGMNFLFFRTSMNDVSKRMGDLRTMPKSAGVWARYYGGKMEYGDMNMDTQYNTLQIGADRWYNNFYYGISASVSDGNGDVDNGSVDNRNYNLGLYGGWLADNGQYIDFIIKRHRVETEGALSNTSGTRSSFDYYNWGTSVSLEYGWRFNCPNTGFWVEPQAELMYGQFEKTSFRTSQNVNVDQDTIKSLVGRLGAALGYTFAENRGSAYLKASVLHDWKGETNTTVSADGASRYYDDDLGGTWGEFALGGTYNITDRFSAYGDVLTTTGSPVRSPWEVSVGVRWMF